MRNPRFCTFTPRRVAYGFGIGDMEGKARRISPTRQTRDMAAMSSRLPPYLQIAALRKRATLEPPPAELPGRPRQS
jgi:hypothetical protein